MAVSDQCPSGRQSTLSSENTPKMPAHSCPIAGGKGCSRHSLQRSLARCHNERDTAFCHPRARAFLGNRVSRLHRFYFEQEDAMHLLQKLIIRSEERRVGKE